MTKNEMAAMYADLYASAAGEYVPRPIVGRDGLPSVVLLPKEELTQIFEDTWEKYMEVFSSQVKVIALLREQVADLEKLNSAETSSGMSATNETTDLESGMPMLPGMEIEPRISQEAMSLCDSLGIKPRHRFWEHVVCHSLPSEGKEEYIVSFLGQFYQSDKEECQLFLGKLREVALGRRSRRWTARFDKSCLKIREV